MPMRLKVSLLDGVSIGGDGAPIEREPFPWSPGMTVFAYLVSEQKGNSRAQPALRDLVRGAGLRRTRGSTSTLNPAKRRLSPAVPA